MTSSRVPQRWLLSINITEYDPELIQFYNQKGFVLENRENSANDPAYLEASLSNGQLPRDKFLSIYSKINLNGFVTRRDYTKAIDEIQMNLKFENCKLLFIYIGGHGVTGDKLLFSDGRTLHYTDIIERFRTKLRMLNKPIICLNNLCRPRSSGKVTDQLPTEVQYLLQQNSLRNEIKADSPTEIYVTYDDRGAHKSRSHTGAFLLLRMYFIIKKYFYTTDAKSQCQFFKKV